MAEDRYLPGFSESGHRSTRARATWVISPDASLEPYLKINVYAECSLSGKRGRKSGRMGEGKIRMEEDRRGKGERRERKGRRGRKRGRERERQERREGAAAYLYQEIIQSAKIIYP